jgi:hypothetical protein
MCGGHIPLGPDDINRCEKCGASVWDKPKEKQHAPLPNPMETWWVMTRAAAAMEGNPIDASALVLSAYVAGGTFMVTAGDLDKFISDHRKLIHIADQLWNCPNDAYMVEHDVYSILGEP